MQSNSLDTSKLPPGKASNKGSEVKPTELDLPCPAKTTVNIPSVKRKLQLPTGKSEVDIPIEKSEVLIPVEKSAITLPIGKSTISITDLP